MDRKVSFILVNVFFISGVIFLLFLDLLGVFGWIQGFIQGVAKNPFFWGLILVGILLESEFYQWVKKSKRSGSSDLLFIIFVFLLMYLVTDDFFTGVLGAFAVYLVIGSFELRDHEIVNKVVLVSTITYIILFASSLVDFFIERLSLPPIDLLDKTFAASLWIILVLGFVFFGRKYIVLFRFMSPQYITLALYLLSWILVATAGFLFNINIFEWIYPALMVTNVIVYLVTGPLIDLFLGVKKLKDVDPEIARMLTSIVNDVKERLGLPGKVKVGFAHYPIINAMAYGAAIDKRICIIAPEGMEIPRDELEAIVAHELGHLKCNHSFKILLVNLLDLVIRWSFGLIPGCSSIPATYYDFAFGKEFILFGQDVGILGFIILNLAIFAFLYVFVRVMEANADAKVKELGMGKQLAKALYNLESFYALGKQTGINVMLLADEKLDKHHEMLNYIEAARTITRQLRRPSRYMWATSLLNSHPATFIRIANMLLPPEKEYTAWQETVLPLTFTRKGGITRFSTRMEVVRKGIDDITRKKFMELFGDELGETNIGKFLESIKIEEFERFIVNMQALVVNRVTENSFHAIIEGLEFQDSISVPYVFVARKTGTGETVKVDPAFHQFHSLQLEAWYAIDGRLTGKLVAIRDDVPEKDVKCTFETGDGKMVEKPFKTVKNQVNSRKVLGARGKHVLLDKDDVLVPLLCTAIEGGSESTNVADLVIVAVENRRGDAPARSGNSPGVLARETSGGEIDGESDGEAVGEGVSEGNDKGDGENDNGKAGKVNTCRFPLDRHRIIPGAQVLPVHDDESYMDRYLDFLEYMRENPGLLKLFLKKPVNNEFTGHVIAVDRDSLGFAFKDVFGDEMDFTLKDLDYMVLHPETFALKPLQQDSMAQKLVYLIQRHRKSVAWIPS